MTIFKYTAMALLVLTGVFTFSIFSYYLFDFVTCIEPTMNGESYYDSAD